MGFEGRRRGGRRSPLRIYFGSSLSCKAQTATQNMAPLRVPLVVLSHIRLLATLNMALTEGCIPLDPHGQFSRGLPDPGCSRPASRAAATATAAGAAPPPCQLLGCNGDWAAAAEVTPGRGSRARPAPEGTAESRSSGGGLL